MDSSYNASRRSVGRGFRIPHREWTPNTIVHPPVGYIDQGYGVKLDGRGRGLRPAGKMQLNVKPPGGGDAILMPKMDRRSSASPSGSSPDRNIEKELQKMDLAELITRPGFGTLGRQISLAANHFEIVLRDGKPITVTQYHVDIVHPRMKLTRDENRLCFWRAITENPSIFPNQFAVAFDGMRQCFTAQRLKFPKESSSYKLEFQIQLCREDKPSLVTIMLHCVGPLVIDPRSVHVAALSERSQMPIQAIDVILRQGRSNSALLTKGWYQFGSSCYKVPDIRGTGVDLSGGREIWHGLFTSAHVVHGYKAFVNMDVTHSAFVRPVNVVDYLIDILNATKKGGYSRQQLHAGVELNDIERKLFEKEIKGMRVRVTHRVGSVREFRVNAVPGSAASLTFVVCSSTNERKSVADYFTERYGPLQFPRFPVLHVGSKRRAAYIPIEHCCIADNQKAMKKLNERQTSAMIRASATDAPTRMRKIQMLASEAKFDKDPWMQAFGLQLDMNMVELNGRQLPAPKIQYGSINNSGKPLAGSSRSTNNTVVPRDGVWRCDGNKFYLPATIGGFGLLVIGRRKDDPLILEFINKLSKTCNDLGMRMPQWPDCVEMVRDVMEIEPAFLKIKREMAAMGKECDLIYAILPQKNSQFYAEIKRVGEVQFGQMTQVTLMKTVIDVAQKNKIQSAQNLAMKMNAKLGGINSKVVFDDVLKQVLLDEPTIFMGVDVTHPSPLDKKSPSIAAVVSNIDQSPMRFAATVKVQKHRREAVIYLVDVMRERLVSYYNATKTKPSRIIVYRDGVAEGQFKEVIREELRGLREACLTLSSDYKPPITFIVTQKRHHTRLFCMNDADATGRSRNIPAGTVVDECITSPECFDFYLCSHAGIQGTSRPTRYHVLCDDSKFTTDQLQMITFSLCHMYSRCSRSVSIPAPVYYADLACTRARYHLADKVGDFGSETLSIGSGNHGGRENVVSEDELIRGATVAESLKMSMYYV